MKDIVMNLEKTIRRDEQGGYPEIRFDMPDRTGRVEVSCEYEPAGENCVIDLGIRDGDRVRGWSGGARKSFYLTPGEATPGYLAGPLQPGEWAVLLGAHRVPDEGCTVRVNIRLTPSHPEWLCGDLHSHTVHSDGTWRLEEAIAIMEDLGCDFLATTDHNTISQNLEHPRRTSLILIPGMEFTTGLGHCNFLGATDPCPDFRISRPEDVHERIRQAKRRGARVVLNHPHCDHCPWEFGFDVEADWVEVWNGPWREANRRTLDWWQEQLVRGKFMTAVGGSDVHRPDRYVRHACPTTWVLASSRTADGILDGIRRGHVFISYAPDGPRIDFRCGRYRIGDTVPAEAEEDTLVLKADRLLPGDRIAVVSERGLEAEYEANREGSREDRWKAEGRRFFRIEIRRRFPQTGDWRMAALSNPIFFEYPHTQAGAHPV